MTASVAVALHPILQGSFAAPGHTMVTIATELPAKESVVPDDPNTQHIVPRSVKGAGVNEQGRQGPATCCADSVPRV